MAGIVEVDQTVFNAAVTFAGGIVAWYLKRIWDELRALQERDEKLLERVQKVEVKIAGDYITRDAFERQVANIEIKLDRILLEQKSIAMNRRGSD